MKKSVIIVFNIACILSGLIGFGHLFAPYVFAWFSYIPEAPIEIIQSINYVNFCFSFLLFGISAFLLSIQKSLFKHNWELILFYGFFNFLWLSRIIIQLIWPWPSSLQTWLLVGFTSEFILVLIPLVYFMTSRFKNV